MGKYGLYCWLGSSIGDGVLFISWMWNCHQNTTVLTTTCCTVSCAQQQWTMTLSWFISFFCFVFVYFVKLFVLACSISNQRRYCCECRLNMPFLRCDGVWYHEFRLMATVAFPGQVCSSIGKARGWCVLVWIGRGGGEGHTVALLATVWSLPISKDVHAFKSYIFDLILSLSHTHTQKCIYTQKRYLVFKYKAWWYHTVLYLLVTFCDWGNSRRNLVWCLISQKRHKNRSLFSDLRTRSCACFLSDWHG